MAISKVVYHSSSSDTTGTTWMDVTDKTVNTKNLFNPNTALASNGESITGQVTLNVSNSNAAKTLGSLTLNSSTGEITGTFIDISLPITGGGTGAQSATSALNNLGIQYSTKTATTSSKGNISSGLAQNRYMIVSVFAPGYVGLAYSPTGQTNHYIKILDPDTLEPIASTSVSCIVAYIDFGSGNISIS